MGCYHSQDAGDGKREQRCPPQGFLSAGGCLWSKQVREVVSSPRARAGAAEGQAPAKEPEAEPWQRLLDLLFATLEQDERVRPRLWWYCQPDECPALAFHPDSGGSPEDAWADRFDALQQLPVEVVVSRLPELGVRPWQQLWAAASAVAWEADACLRGLIPSDVGTSVREPPSSSRLRAVLGSELYELGRRTAPVESRTEASPVALPSPTAAAAAPSPSSSGGTAAPSPAPSSRRGSGGGGGPPAAAAAWQAACEAVRQAASTEQPPPPLEVLAAAFAEVPGGAGVTPDALACVLGLTNARRQLLLLQDQLSWLAQVVLTALTREDLHAQLLGTLRSGAASRRGAGGAAGGEAEDEAAPDDPGSAAPALRALARAGFELQGILFRTVVDPLEWRAARAEVRRGVPPPAFRGGPGCTPGSSPSSFFSAAQGGSAGRLAVTVEGRGLRLLAAPAMPPVGGEEHDAAARAPDAAADCASWVVHWLRSRGALPADEEAVRRRCALLPNPRGLLSLRPALAAAAAQVAGRADELLADSGSPSLPAQQPLLALVFGSSLTEKQELSPGHCSQPLVVSAESRSLLLARVASALGCKRSDLRRHAAGGAGLCHAFGCWFEVWHLPGQADAGAPRPIWRWGTGRFAMLCVVEVPADDERLFGLPERARQARARALEPTGLPSHPWALRQLLRSFRMPARFAACVAAPGLAGPGPRWRQEPIGDAEAWAPGRPTPRRLDEVVGVELLATAGKHLVTMLLAGDGVLTLLSPRDPIAPPTAGSAAERGPAAPEEEPHRLGSREPQVGPIEDELPIPPLQPKARPLTPRSESRPCSPVPADRDWRVPSPRPAAPPPQPSPPPPDCGADPPAGTAHGLVSAHAEEAALLLAALDVPEAPTGRQAAEAAARLGLLLVAFWARLVYSTQQLGAVLALEHATPPTRPECSGGEEELLMQVGQRLLHAACRTPHALVQALSFHLGANLVAPKLPQVLAPGELSLALVPLALPAPGPPRPPPPRAPDGSAPAVGGSSPPASPLQLRARAPLVPEEVRKELVAESLLAVGLPLLAAIGPEDGHGARREGGDTEDAGPSEATPADSVNYKAALPVIVAGAHALVPGATPCLGLALFISHQLVDFRFPQHRGQRALDLLRAAQWLLLASGQEAGATGPDPDAPPQLSPQSSPQSRLSGGSGPAATPGPEAVALRRGGHGPREAHVAKMVNTALQLLQAAAALMGGLQPCPAQLRVALAALRASAAERRGNISAALADYRRALSELEEAWGDARQPGSRGHPFGLLLTWKLGLAAYCAGGAREADRAADAFRSLMALHASGCPFAWGPPSRELLTQDADVGAALWEAEREAWASGALPKWWTAYEVLAGGADLRWTPLQEVRPGGTVEPEEEAGGRSASPQAGEAARRAAEGGASSSPPPEATAEATGEALFSCGSNETGQLGIGRPTVPVPVSVQGSPTSQPARGNQPNGFRDDAGFDLWWSPRPVWVAAFKEVALRAVACGEEHSLAVDSVGRLFAWGSDSWNQLGLVPDLHRDGTGEKVCLPYPLPAACIPALAATPPDDGEDDVPTERRAEGGAHGVETPRSLPVAFVAVACGARFSLALDSSGGVWAWGAGEGGVLGLGPAGLGGRPVPTPLDALRGAGGGSRPPCSAVACGSYHSMALIGDGKLFVWGRAEGGQLGLSEACLAEHIESFGLDDTCVCLPSCVRFTRDLEVSGISVELAAGESPKPTAEEDPVRVTQVAGGDVHTLALDTSGHVWSWGWGEFGQLGLGFSHASFEAGAGGMSSKRLLPEVIQANHFDFAPIRFIACGGAFSVAIADPGVTAPGEPAYDGNLYLWGANEVGQCAKAPKEPPEVVVPTKALSLKHVIVRSVACGGAHAVAVDSEGRAHAWGASQYGQLGTSPTAQLRLPPLGVLARSGADVSAEAPGHLPALVQTPPRVYVTRAACGLQHSLLLCGSAPASPTSADGGSSEATSST